MIFDEINVKECRLLCKFEGIIFLCIRLEDYNYRSMYYSSKK